MLMKVLLLVTAASIVRAQLPWSCSFEDGQGSDGFCGMVQATDDNFDWSRQSGSTPSGQTGPSSAQEGRYYIFMEASDPRQQGDKIRINTPILNYRGTVCLRYYYNLNGADMGSLQVYTQDGSSRVYVTSTLVQGNVGDTWILVEVDVQVPSSNARIGWEATRGSAYRGDAAVDNINIRGGSCSGPVVTIPPTQPPGGSGLSLPWACNFDSNSICDMIQRTDEQFDWTVQRGGTPSSDTGPDRAQSGEYYIFIETSDPRRSGDIASIETGDIGRTGSVCLTFYHNIYGSNINYLQVYTTRGSNSARNPVSGGRLEGQQSSSQSDWRQLRLDISLGVDNRIGFEAARGNGIRGDIAIDSIRIDAGTCSGGPVVTSGPGPAVTDPPTPAITDFFSCDIEGDGRNNRNCYLQQDNGDNFNWIQGSGNTLTGAMFRRKIGPNRYPWTGPGNAYRGTYYLFTESTGRRGGDVARIFLRGDDFRAGSSNMCLRFWYNMNGFHMGSLRVETRIDGRRGTRWMLSGDQFQGWKEAAVDLDMRRVTEVSLAATMKNTVGSSDVAIDNISMRSGRCQSPVSSGLVWECNFEMNDGAASLCGMEQDEGDVFDWTLRSGATPSVETGPSLAFNGQYYIHIEASSPRRPGDRASIMVPDLDRDGNVCLRFQVHMYGFHTGSLEVFRMRSGQRLTQGETESGDKGNRWFSKAVTIDLRRGDRIGFTGVRGTEYSGDIGIDNVRISPGAC